MTLNDHASSYRIAQCDFQRNKRKPYYHRQKFDSAFNYYKVHADIRENFAEKGESKRQQSGQKTAIFGTLGRHIFSIFRDKTNIIIQ